MSPESTVPDSSAAGSDDPLDAVVASCLESAGDDLERAVQRACESHPESAGEIRRRIERLRALGLLSPEPGSAGDSFPERLGDFQLLERLGGGGMGVVFRARQASLGREVALKLIRPEHLFFPQARARFRREVEAAGRLQHPGIVPIHSVGEERGLPYLAMELVHGATLADALSELAGREPDRLTAGDLAAALERARPPWASVPPGPVAPDSGSYVEAVLRLVLQVAHALQHAHERDVLHRDVKPSNVAVAPGGRALLFDFGLAALVEPDPGAADGVNRLTASSAEIGSLPYMSPEQLRGRTGELGPRTDVYGLGVTLYELLTLRLPFVQRDPLELRAAILEGTPRSLRALNRAVSRDLETVCAKAMEPSPARRYRDAAALARDLSSVLEHRPVEARPPGRARELAALVRRHPLLTTLLAAAVALPSALSWQQRRHAGELRLALDEARQERQAARVEARTAGAISDFLLELFDSVDPSIAQGREVTARDLLDQAARELETALETEPVVRMRLLAAIGESYGSLGQWGPAREALERALAAGEGLPEGLELARVLSALAMLDHNQGRPEALERALQAAELHRRLAPEPSFQLADVLLTCGLVLHGHRRLDEAEAVYREMLDIVEALPGDQRAGRVGVLANLANLHIVRGDFELALAEARETVELQRSISPDPHPAIGSALNAMARALSGLGQHEQALPILDEILAEERRLTGTESTRYAAFLSNKGDTLIAAGRAEQGLELLEQAADLFARTAPAAHGNAIVARERLGSAYIALARWEAALELYTELLPVAESGSDPVRALSIAHRLAVCREALGDREGLERGARSALARARQLASPADDGSECQLAALLARSLARRGELAAAEEALAAGLAACGTSSEPAATGAPAWVRLTTGVLARAAGDEARARAALEPLAALEAEGAARTVPALARAQLAALEAAAASPRAGELASRAAGELEDLLGHEHPEARSARELLERLP